MIEHGSGDMAIIADVRHPSWRALPRMGMTLALLVVAALALGQAPTVSAAEREFLARLKEAATLFTEKQDSAGSIKALEMLRQEQPENFDVNSWLGFVQLRSGQAAAAVGPLSKARSIKGDDESVLANLGLAHDTLQDWPKAIEAYQALVALKPDNPSYQAKLGTAQLSGGQVDAAIATLEKADAAAPGDTAVSLNLASAYVRANRSDDARRVYSRFNTETADPEARATALSWLGFDHLQAGRYREAIPLLEQARAARPNDLEVLNNLATAYSRVDPPEDTKALEVYRGMTRLDPQLSMPWYNIGVIALRQGRAADALAANREALARNPNDPFARNNLGRAQELSGDLNAAVASYEAAAQADPQNKTFQRNAGTANASLRRYDRAVAQLERARALGDDDPQIRVTLGAAYVQLGQLDKARPLLEGAEGSIRPDPQAQASYWSTLAQLREKSGDADGALVATRRAVDAKGDDPELRKNLAIVLYKRGDLTGALTEYLAVRDLRPTDPDAHSDLGTVFFALDRKEEAVASWRQAVRLRPTDNRTRLNLATAQWDLNDADGALFHWNTVLKTDPKNADSMNGVGLHALQAGRLRDAERQFRAVIAAHPRYLASYNNLAAVLERLDQRPQAIQILERALRIDPGFAPARRNLERLKKAESGG